MIRTDVVLFEFQGDGLTRTFDVPIEGIPIAPEGVSNFVATRVDGDSVEALLRYGIDFQYIANFNPRGFSESITLTLTVPLPAGNKLVVVRTTPVIGISQYPDSGVPPKKVERDFDHVIKILQEHGYKIGKFEEDIEALKERDDDLQEQIDDKIGKGDPLPEHAQQHAAGGRDQLTPEMIDALREAPDTGRLYAATTTNGTPGWVELLFPAGEISATVVVQGSSFVADGTSMEFGVAINHTMDTNLVQAIVYDDVTGRRVHFATTVPNPNTVILKSAVVQPAGRVFRCMLYGMGRIDPAWFKDVVTYQQDATAAEWVINHGMHNATPIVLVLNKQKQIVVPDIDYTNATGDSITLRFPYMEEGGVPGCSGIAVLYGWVGENFEVRKKPVSGTFTNETMLTINHNLGTSKPTVLVTAPGNVVINAEVDYDNATLDQITLRFAKPRSGEYTIGVR